MITEFDRTFKKPEKPGKAVIRQMSGQTAGQSIAEAAQEDGFDIPSVKQTTAKRYVLTGGSETIPSLHFLGRWREARIRDLPAILYQRQAL
jgi:hypothetical protein